MSAVNAGGARRQVVLSFVRDGQTLSITVDASLSERHQKTAQVSDHQVAKGTNVADNIRPLPSRLQLECFITNTPLALPADNADGVTAENVGGVLKFSAPFDRVANVHDLIKSALEEPLLWSVFTTLESYEEMAVESYVVPRNVQLGDALRFTMDLKKIRLVDVNTVDALPGRTTPNKGAKTGKEASGEQENKLRSVLSKTWGWLTG